MGKNALTGYFLSFPAITLILIIYVIPTFVVLLISFTDYTLVRDGFDFVGGEHYAKMLSDDIFLNSLSATVVYAIIVLPVGFSLGLVLAISIFEKKKFKSLFEVFYFMPVTSTLTAMALVWNALLDPIGVINSTIASFGGETIAFLGSGDIVLYSLALISLWGIIGFNMVLFLAGLTAIPGHLYDAGKIDGITGTLDKFVYITWPMLAPTSMFVAVTNSINAFKLFDIVAILTQGGPDNASEVFLYLTYLEAFEYFNMGYASALSIVFLGIIFVFALIQARFIDTKVNY